MNSSLKYMYFLAVGSLQVISLYFYCVCLATGRSWLSGLIFPYLFSSLLDLPVRVYWVFPTEFLLWNPDCLLEVRCFWWTTRETQVGFWQQQAWVPASSFYGLLVASKQLCFAESAILRNSVRPAPWGWICCEPADSLPYTHEPQESWLSFAGGIWSLEAHLPSQMTFFNLKWLLAGSRDPRSPRSTISSWVVLSHARWAVNNQAQSHCVAHQAFWYRCSQRDMMRLRVMGRP